jgi:hypothetical protein
MLMAAQPSEKRRVDAVVERAPGRAARESRPAMGILRSLPKRTVGTLCAGWS